MASKVDPTVLHGWRCNARTIPVRCKHCQAEVFYFTCDCGHQVVFGSLGIPWTKHDCPERRALLIDRYGSAAVEQDQTVVMLPGIETAYAEQVLRAAAALQRHDYMPPDIVPQLPYHGAQTSEIGIVRQIVPEVDIYSRFRLSRGSLALAMLKSAGEAPYTQIIIDVEALADEDHSRFTFLIGRERLERAEVVTGDLVRCMLQGLFLNSQLFWICSELHNILTANLDS